MEKILFPLILLLDAVKRRTLPAWIREGLEKMDREKQKKLERERMEQEQAKMANDDDAEHQADEEGDGPHVPRKSKFVSGLDGEFYQASCVILAVIWHQKSVIYV